MTVPLLCCSSVLFVLYSLCDYGFYQAVAAPESVVRLLQAGEYRNIPETLHHFHSLAMLLSLTVAGLEFSLPYDILWKKINADVVASAPVLSISTRFFLH